MPSTNPPDPSAPAPVLPAPPSSLVPPPVKDPGLPRFSRGAAVAAILALMPIVATALFVAGAALSDVLDLPFHLRDDTVAGVMAVCALGSFAGFCVAVGATHHLGGFRVQDRPRGRWLAILAIPVGLLASFWGAVIALIATADFSRGRQLRERGRAVFAPLVVPSKGPAGGPPGQGPAGGARWLGRADFVDSAPGGAPAGVASAWRENGKTEHASVAAFARLATELVALGAPAKLVEDAHKDALDEIRHARLCFDLARDLDGQDLEPGAFPAARARPSSFLAGLTRPGALARLAVESLIDGALNEGTSARAVARLAQRTPEPRVRAVLVAIAGDEGRHARHGHDVLAWCLKEGGFVVEQAVRGALWTLPPRMGASLVAEADDGRFERWGIPGRALLDEAYDEVRAEVVAMVAAKVVTKGRALVG